MSFQDVLHLERLRILHTLRMAIFHGLLDSWNRCIRLGHSPHEPDFVAGLALESTPLIYHVLSNIFSSHGIQFSLASVFCHQTPKVTYGSSNSCCELGDLLLVHVHTGANGDVIRNALLYQAKMSDHAPHSVGNNEIHQLELYRRWPEFEYTYSGDLNGEKRDVRPKQAHRGAQYLLIDKRPPHDPNSGLCGLAGTYPVASCMAGDILHSHNSLSGEIFDIMLGLSGRPFYARSGTSNMDDWSLVVWDLIEVGLKKSFNRKHSGRASVSRHGGGPVNLSAMDGFCVAMRTSPSASTTVNEILGPDKAGDLFSGAGDEDTPPTQALNYDKIHGPDAGASLIILETSQG